MESDGTTVVEVAPPPSRTTGRRPGTIARRVAIALFAYLALSFLIPEVVPRLATLPEPSIGTTAPCTNSDSCYG